MTLTGSVGFFGIAAGLFLIGDNTAFVGCSYPMNPEAVGSNMLLANTPTTFGVTVSFSGALAAPFWVQLLAQATVVNCTLVFKNLPSFSVACVVVTELGLFIGQHNSFVDQAGHSAQDTTGDTHTTTTLDNLAINTNTLTAGMSVTGSNIQAGTTIAVILSASSVQLSLAATGSAAGQAVSFEIATGKRYDVQTNSVIESIFDGRAAYPGNAAGTTASGGQYA